MKSITYHSLFILVTKLCSRCETQQCSHRMFSDLPGFVSKVCGTVYQTNANITEILSQIVTRCSCFWQEVRALQPLHQSNLFATKSTNWVPYHDDQKSAFIHGKNSGFKRFYCWTRWALAATTHKQWSGQGYLSLIMNISKSLWFTFKLHYQLKSCIIFAVFMWTQSLTPLSCTSVKEP